MATTIEPAVQVTENIQEPVPDNNQPVGEATPTPAPGDDTQPVRRSSADAFRALTARLKNGDASSSQVTPDVAISSETDVASAEIFEDAQAPATSYPPVPAEPPLTEVVEQPTLQPHEFLELQVAVEPDEPVFAIENTEFSETDSAPNADEPILADDQFEAQSTQDCAPSDPQAETTGGCGDAVPDVLLAELPAEEFPAEQSQRQVYGGPASFDTNSGVWEQTAEQEMAKTPPDHIPAIETSDEPELVDIASAELVAEPEIVDDVLVGVGPSGFDLEPADILPAYTTVQEVDTPAVDTQPEEHFIDADSSEQFHEESHIVERIESPKDGEPPLAAVTDLPDQADLQIMEAPDVQFQPALDQPSSSGLSAEQSLAQEPVASDIEDESAITASEMTEDILEFAGSGEDHSTSETSTEYESSDAREQDNPSNDHTALLQSVVADCATGDSAKVTDEPSSGDVDCSTGFEVDEAREPEPLTRGQQVADQISAVADADTDSQLHEQTAQTDSDVSGPNSRDDEPDRPDDQDIETEPELVDQSDIVSEDEQPTSDVSESEKSKLASAAWVSKEISSDDSDEFVPGNADPQAGETARMLLDIMSKPSGAAQPQERALAADTLLRLAPKIPVTNLIALSERICMMEKPPALLVDKLIKHPRHEVAGPLLETCAEISDQVLLKVITSGDRDKQRMIARRRSLTPTMCDALLEYGDASVYLTIVRNPGASISHEAFMKLSEHAKNQASLQAPLVTRGDTSAPVAFELFWFLPSELRRYVLSRFLTDSETLDKILKITLAVDGADSIDGRMGEAKFADKDKMADLVDLIAEGALEDASALLAQLAGINTANAQRIISDHEGEPITVAMKAIGYSRNDYPATVDKWRNSPSAISKSQRTTAELQGLFDSLSFNKARMLLTYWDWAADKSGPYSRKAA